MKKILMILLSLALVLSMAGAVAAADVTDSSSKVQITIQETFELDIPVKSMDLKEADDGTTATGQYNVSIKNARVNPGDSCYLFVSSGNGWSLITSTGSDDTAKTHAIPYSVSKADTENAETKETVVAKAEGETQKPSKDAKVSIMTLTADTTSQTTGTMEKKVWLTFTLDAPLIYAGQYADTLTFTISKTDYSKQQSESTES